MSSQAETSEDVSIEKHIQTLRSPYDAALRYQTIVSQYVRPTVHSLQQEAHSLAAAAMSMIQVRPTLVDVLSNMLMFLGLDTSCRSVACVHVVQDGMSVATLCSSCGVLHPHVSPFWLSEIE